MKTHPNVAVSCFPDFAPLCTYHFLNEIKNPDWLVLITFWSLHKNNKPTVKKLPLRDCISQHTTSEINCGKYLLHTRTPTHFTAAHNCIIKNRLKLCDNSTNVRNASLCMDFPFHCTFPSLACSGNHIYINCATQQTQFNNSLSAKAFSVIKQRWKRGKVGSIARNAFLPHLT